MILICSPCVCVKYYVKYGSIINFNIACHKCMCPPTHTDYAGYAYTSDLLHLQSCVNPSPPALPLELSRIISPLIPSAWSHFLQFHPDQGYAKYLLTGITQGFRIGFQYTSPTLLSAKSNHPSALDHPDIVSKSLEAEQEKGRLIDPISPSRYPHLHVSSLGVIPKKHSSKWRLIVALSNMGEALMTVLITHVVPFRI